MMLACFIVFAVVALWCEYVMWRRVGRKCGCRRARVVCRVSGILVWLAFAVCIVVMLAGGADNNVAIRGVGCVFLAFMLNGCAKMIFVLAGWIGRMVGCVKAMRVVAYSLVVLLIIVIVCGMTFWRDNIRTERIVFNSERVPENFDGYRIVLFSDIHTGLLFGRDRLLYRLVDTVNALDADMVINCGDIVNHDYSELDASVLEILSGIRAADGIWSVLGNHDLGIYMRDTLDVSPAENIHCIEAAQRIIGWHVLKNGSEFVVRGDDTIAVTGVDFPQELIHRSHGKASAGVAVGLAYDCVPEGMFNITVSHAPQMWTAIKDAGRGDLTVSGHVHSLQIKLVLGDWRWSPAAWLYEEWSGAYRDGWHLLYVNDGIGYAMFPVRIGVRPEVTLIILERDEGDCIGSGVE